MEYFETIQKTVYKKDPRPIKSFLSLMQRLIPTVKIEYTPNYMIIDGIDKHHIAYGKMVIQGAQNFTFGSEIEPVFVETEEALKILKKGRKEGTELEIDNETMTLRVNGTTYKIPVIEKPEYYNIPCLPKKDDYPADIVINPHNLKKLFTLKSEKDRISVDVKKDKITLNIPINNFETIKLEHELAVEAEKEFETGISLQILKKIFMGAENILPAGIMQFDDNYKPIRIEINNFNVIASYPKYMIEIYIAPVVR